MHKGMPWEQGNLRRSGGHSDVHTAQVGMAGIAVNARRLFALKAQFDPGKRFRNKLWDKYCMG